MCYVSSSLAHDLLQVSFGFSGFQRTYIILFSLLVLPVSLWFWSGCAFSCFSRSKSPTITVAMSVRSRGWCCFCVVFEFFFLWDIQNQSIIFFFADTLCFQSRFFTWHDQKVGLKNNNKKYIPNPKDREHRMFVNAFLPTYSNYNNQGTTA